MEKIFPFQPTSIIPYFGNRLLPSQCTILTENLSTSQCKILQRPALGTPKQNHLVSKKKSKIERKLSTNQEENVLLISLLTYEISLLCRRIKQTDNRTHLKLILMQSFLINLHIILQHLSKYSKIAINSYKKILQFITTLIKTSKFLCFWLSHSLARG